MRAARRAYVWDAPTRLFHWALVATIAFSWWSARSDHMDWHLTSGLTACGLLLFRILWGLFGTSTARFGQFVKGPRAVWRYLRPAAGDPRVAPIGHNPLGGWSVVAMLVVLGTQIASGLFAVDVDGIESGPLSRFVSFDGGRIAARIHGISFTLLEGLVVLHLLAILFYLLVRRRNLIGAMVTGHDRAAGAGREMVALVPVWRVAAAAGVAGGLAWWIGGGLAI